MLPHSTPSGDKDFGGVQWGRDYAGVNKLEKLGRKGQHVGEPGDGVGGRALMDAKGIRFSPIQDSFLWGLGPVVLGSESFSKQDF